MGECFEIGLMVFFNDLFGIICVVFGDVKYWELNNIIFFQEDREWLEGEVVEQAFYFGILDESIYFYLNFVIEQFMLEW